MTGFAATVPPALNTVVASQDQTTEAPEEKLRAPDSAGQIPTSVRVSTPYYRDIVNLLSSCSSLPASQAEKKAELFSQAYKAFSGHDSLRVQDGGTQLKSGEHEIVRCLFYLALPPSEGAKRAHDHATVQRDHVS